MRTQSITSNFPSATNWEGTGCDCLWDGASVLNQSQSEAKQN